MSQALRSCGFCLGLLVFFARFAGANPIISEFMADNATTIADEDGSYSDWIEIHNPTPSAINLDQWCLTDKASLPAKWRFPAVTLEPGGFLLVWASGKNRSNPAAPLHTNFSLSASGEYLALVRPDGVTVQTGFTPAYPALAADEAYGYQFTTTNLIAPATAAKFHIPASATLGTTWRNLAFNDGVAGWTSGNTGLGFGVLAPGIMVRQVAKKLTFGFISNITSIATADALIALAPGNSNIAADATVLANTVNYLGEGPDGHYGTNRVLPTNTVNNYAIHATGSVVISTAGPYTFGLNSDDGGRIKIDGTTVMLDDSSHGPTDHLGNITLSVGTHPFDVVMWDGSGGDEVEFYAAPGVKTVWDASMQLVGDTANGGLPALTLPTGTGGLVQTNLQAAMKGINATCYVRRSFTVGNPAAFTTLSLKMTYNDGFAAFLNGTALASRNASGALLYNSTSTATRLATDTLVPESINVTAVLPQLLTGNNILAIQGLNNAASDSSFLVLPELIAGSINETASAVYYSGGQATPGALNGAFSYLGKVADTEFSVKRGIYFAPINVAITTTTPGAQIRYTTNGSDPTPTSGTPYTGPISIATTTVLRAMAYRSNWQSTNTDTQTYLFPNDVILQSANGAAPANWPASSGTAQVLDFGMDPDIINHVDPNLGGANSVKNALLSIPSVCLTTPLPNLFNMPLPDSTTSQGIYANSGERGFAWERPAHIEWIAPPDAANPNGHVEFHLGAGLRIRGGASRTNTNPKHGFHLYFREEYGAKKLDFPLFGKGGSYEFDQIDFRTAQNYSWSNEGDARNTFLREESTRLAHRDMGHQHGRLRYFHLYINGQYWGLYNTEERTEASYAEAYFGGSKDDYDVVKNEQDSGYVVGVTDGNLLAWQDLWNKSKAHLANPTNANYFRMMGRGADGVTPTADPVLLDDRNLIDYMLLTYWTGNLDGAVSAFLLNNNANNWFAIRNRTGSTGFEYFVHDFEHTFLNVNEDRTGPFNNTNYTSFTYSNPQFLHQDLMANPEYRIRWADRVQQHMFNNGALAAAQWSNRINGLAGTVDEAIIAESARWGDAKQATPYTRQSWMTAQNTLLDYLPARGPIVLAQLRADNLYPSIDAPVLTPFNGYLPVGSEVVMTAPAGSLIYYMADGTDPRAVGGAIRPGAISYVAGGINETLIPLSAAGWKYLHTGVNLGTAWSAASFDDGAWPVGAAELGYGDGDENAAGGLIPIIDLDPGTAGDQKVATTYFRKSFTVANPLEIISASVSVEYDDAVAVYLNGTYIGGTLPTHPAFDFYSGTTIEDTIMAIVVPPALFVNGPNTIAVEIHQTSNSSSDISMNLSLAAIRSSAAAHLYLTNGPVQPLKVRGYETSTSTWSALVDTTYLLNTEPASTANLAISEIMFHPPDPDANEASLGYSDADDFEFIELLNIGPKTLDLDGVYFYGAIDFDFHQSLLSRALAPGARVIVAARKPAFEQRYGSGKPVAGSYKGHMNNAGERMVLYAANGSIIRDFTFDDLPPWPAADGNGFSLIRTAPNGNLLDDQPATAWRASVYPGGSAGDDDLHQFSRWKALHAITDGAGDPDGDGLSNVLEYCLGGSLETMDQPRNLTPGSGIFTVGGIPNKYTTLSYQRRQFLSDVTFVIESAPNLNGGWTPANPVFLNAVPNGDGSETFHLRAANPQASEGATRFYRLRMEIAP